MKSGDQFYITISLQASLSVLNLMRNQFGGVAQLVRVPASHAGGPGFEPQRVHQEKEVHLHDVLLFLYVQAGLVRTPQRKLFSPPCQSAQPHHKTLPRNAVKGILGRAPACPP